jgi:23S rRNA (guanosine2251-2'-O)-methyltransferase
MDNQHTSIILILDNLRSVQNVASLFRTCECFGISEIVLCGTTPAPVDRFGRIRQDFAKISLGAENLVTWRYFATTAQACEHTRQLNYDVFALEQSEFAVMLQDIVLESNTDAEAKCALILGNEVTGVSPEIMSLCDLTLEIPQFGQKESLNVCIAGSIALYHLRFVASTVS